LTLIRTHIKEKYEAKVLALKLDIDKAGLLQACKEIIETILFCLPNAYKGTVYRIGNPPELVAKQVTSGVIDEERTAISWGIPEKSRHLPADHGSNTETNPVAPRRPWHGVWKNRKVGPLKIRKMINEAPGSNWRDCKRTSTTWNRF